METVVEMQDASWAQSLSCSCTKPEIVIAYQWRAARKAPVWPSSDYLT